MAKQRISNWEIRRRILKGQVEAEAAYIRKRSAVSKIYFSQPERQRNLETAVEQFMDRDGTPEYERPFLKRRLCQDLGQEGGKETDARKKQGELAF